MVAAPGKPAHGGGTSVSQVAGMIPPFESGSRTPAAGGSDTGTPARGQKCLPFSLLELRLRAAFSTALRWSVLRAFRISPRTPRHS